MNHSLLQAISGVLRTYNSEESLKSTGQDAFSQELCRAWTQETQVIPEENAPTYFSDTYLFVCFFVCLFVLSFEAGSQHIALAGLNATRLINQAGLKLKSGWSVSQMLRLKACATTNKWSGKCSLESQFC